jgi:hypothetical protein
VQKIKSRFLAHGEEQIFTVTPHIMLFLLKIFWDIVVTGVLFFVMVYSYNIGLLAAETAFFLFLVVWFLFVFFSLIEAFVDWKYDFIFLTTDKLIIVDQMSFFRKSITPINLENLGDVVAQTQWLNLFNFGIMRFSLKEGNGPEIVLKYIPDADKLVAKIAQQITLYQRRKDFIVPYRHPDEL